MKISISMSGPMCWFEMKLRTSRPVRRSTWSMNRCCIAIWNAQDRRQLCIGILWREVPIRWTRSATRSPDDCASWSPSPRVSDVPLGRADISSNARLIAPKRPVEPVSAASFLPDSVRIDTELDRGRLIPQDFLAGRESIPQLASPGAKTA